MTDGQDLLVAREAVRGFALGLPGAVEEFPWGESVAKVNNRIFVFLGPAGGGAQPAVTVKLADEDLHAHALTLPGAQPARYGLGKSGWVRVPLSGHETTPAELLCDFVEESYRAVAPRRLVAEWDAG